ncbi:unnamed protein product [Notodromas monacha]|uniref:VWFA domain-containing protein n=1 Tax=Notodromas monacha TaxID=399045 RepID=A0A7R9BT69_9CRUS|nr:unnamed protein product [Notodromas monacha]CAG0920951.1 unnamed protein product [Notodromas monacha]
MSRGRRVVATGGLCVVMCLVFADHSSGQMETVFNVPGMFDYENDSGKLREAEIDFWITKIETHLKSFSTKMTKYDIIEKNFKRNLNDNDFNTSMEDPHDIVRALARDISRMIGKKEAALKRLMDTMENSGLDEARRSKASSMRSAAYLDARKLPRCQPNSPARDSDCIDLTNANPRFNVDINTTYSVIHVPRNVYHRAAEWQTDSEFIHDDVFDCRMRPWYIRAATSPKHMVILLDWSGSMTGLRREIAKHVVFSILDTLNDDDFFNIYKFAQDTEPVVPCLNDTLVQANTENVELFKGSLDEGKTEYIANLSLALTRAFELLRRYNDTSSGGDKCNQAIMLVTDGAPENYQEIFKKYNRPNMYVRLFTYLIGKEVTDDFYPLRKPPPRVPPAANFDEDDVIDDGGAANDANVTAEADDESLLVTSTPDDEQRQQLPTPTSTASSVLMREKREGGDQRESSFSNDDDDDEVTQVAVCHGVSCVNNCRDSTKLSDWLWEKKQRQKQRFRYLNFRNIKRAIDYNEKQWFESHGADKARMKMGAVDANYVRESYLNYLASGNLNGWPSPQAKREAFELTHVNTSCNASFRFWRLSSDDGKQKRQANILGVVGIDVPIADFQMLAPHHKLGVNGYFFMVTNNGHIMFHRDFRPVYKDYMLKPNYNSVDLFEVELEEGVEGLFANDTRLLKMREKIVRGENGFEKKLRVKVPLDNLKRVAVLEQDYGYFPVQREDSPEARRSMPDAPIFMPDSRSSASDGQFGVFPEYFSLTVNCTHRVYCSYHRKDIQRHRFETPEEELIHFLERMMKPPNFQWRPERVPLNDSDPGDKDLVQFLLFDAMATDVYNASDNGVKYDR